MTGEFFLFKLIDNKMLRSFDVMIELMSQFIKEHVHTTLYVISFIISDSYSVLL